MRRALAEDDIDALLDRPSLASWLSTVGVMALAMTPLGLILGGIYGAVLISATLLLVWLVSLIWVLAQQGTLGATNLLPSAIMVTGWPWISGLLQILASLDR